MKRPFPVDPTLTAIAIGYRNPAQAMIAPRVLPPVPVTQETFKWTEYPIAEAFTLPNTAVGRKGQVPQMEFNGTEKADSVADYGMDAPIPNSDVQAAAAARAEGRSTLDPEKLATEQLTGLIELDREVRVATVVQDTNNYAADKKVTLAGTAQLSDFVNSDPVGVISTGFESTLIYRPNTVVMGRAVWNVIRRHKKLINAVKGGLTEEGLITKQQFADLFEIDMERLLIGEGYVNTANKGQAVNLSRVWGKHIELLYIDPSKGSAQDPKITYGFTAVLEGRVAGSIDDPDIGLQGGRRTRVGERVKELVCAKDVGYQIRNAVA